MFGVRSSLDPLFLTSFFCRLIGPLVSPERFLVKNLCSMTERRERKRFVLAENTRGDFDM